MGALETEVATFKEMGRKVGVGLTQFVDWVGGKTNDLVTSRSLSDCLAAIRVTIDQKDPGARLTQLFGAGCSGPPASTADQNRTRRNRHGRGQGSTLMPDFSAIVRSRANMVSITSPATTGLRSIIAVTSCA